MPPCLDSRSVLRQNNRKKIWKSIKENRNTKSFILLASRHLFTFSASVFLALNIKSLDISLDSALKVSLNLFIFL